LTGVDVNKSDMIDLIADKSDISKASAARALDAMLEGITAALRNGEQVALVGFGTFAVKDRAERQGRNPQTGATMVIKASRIPGFKPGKALKDAVN
jgi:DNA-binding protein HU-beta